MDDEVVKDAVDSLPSPPSSRWPHSQWRCSDAAWLLKMLRETAPTLAIIKVAGRQRGGPSGRTARLPDPARRCRLCPNPHGPVHRFRSLLPRTWQQQGSGFAVSTKQDSLGFSVVGNSGTGDCFWLAQQQLAGLEPQNAKAASYAWALQAKHPALLEKHAFFAQKVPATEAQIEAAVLNGAW